MVELYNVEGENKRLYDAYAYLVTLEPFKEKLKVIKKKKQKAN